MSIKTTLPRESGLLSVVIPAYCEEEAVPITAKTIADLLTTASIPFEIIFVDDGSKDGTWNAIEQANRSDQRVVGISFSRNFGKESAMFAGISQSVGDCVLVIDCDLQHPPEKMIEMYKLWQSGYQVVEGVKLSRGKENPVHTFAAKSFYHFISRSTGLDMGNSSDFKLLDRQVVDELLKMGEQNGFFRALSSWVGFSTAQVTFHVEERVAGQSKWSMRQLVRYAVSNLSSFSTAPLQLVTFLGSITFIFSVILGIHSLWKKLTGQVLEGFTTVILLQLFIGSALMICLGIIGFYIAKIYEEIKARPRYIVEAKIGDQQKGST